MSARRRPREGGAPAGGAAADPARALFAVGAHAPGATPVDPDEAADLISPGVATLAELNAYEQANIVAATAWALRTRRRPRPDAVLDAGFLFELHRRMFAETWRWAGETRRTDKNIGVHWPTIRVALRERVQDARYWLEHATYGHDEIAVRFHHGIVLVHPFPNGNGRWSRLAADALLHALRAEPFSWGAADLAGSGAARAAYLGALRAADRGDVGPLLAFARS